MNFNEAVKEIMLISDLGNRYFQSSEPWRLIKGSKEDKDKAGKICGLCLNIIKNISILIQPILPKFSSELQKQLNLKNLKWDDINFSLKSHKINKEKIIVEKIEEKIQEFPLKLKVAKIGSVEDHPNADKLYVVKIDLGAEKRQLVAGIKPYYRKEELQNKKIIVVTNLKHAKLRGIKSEGMLLAAQDDKGNVGLLTVKNSKLGSEAKFGSLENSDREISFEYFQKISMYVKEGKVFFNNLELKTDKEAISVEKVEGDAKVR